MDLINKLTKIILNIADALTPFVQYVWVWILLLACVIFFITIAGIISRRKY